MRLGRRRTATNSGYFGPAVASPGPVQTHQEATPPDFGLQRWVVAFDRLGDSLDRGGMLRTWLPVRRTCKKRYLIYVAATNRRRCS